jgi:pyruvate dehydrogenase E2 component (dihydrolipoamide acetyltransferase)
VTIEKDIVFPDLGGAADVTVIELLVQPHDSVEAEQPLLTLEGDKATMEVPAPFACTITALAVQVGDTVNAGDLLGKATVADSKAAAPTPVATTPTLTEARFPDLGGASDVTVIELLVQPGATVVEEQPLLTLEGDKATMEVPSPHAGVLQSLAVQVGDTVNAGDLLGMIEAEASTPVAPAPEAAPTPQAVVDMPVGEPMAEDQGALVYAGPSVRRLAYEFGIDLGQVKATGPKGRLLKEDLQRYVKQRLSGGGSALPAMPTVDFTQFGEVSVKPLNKIKQLTGAFLSRNWLHIPHVTQHGYVDITDLEALRNAHKKAYADQGARLTLLVFVMRALAESLREFPQVNASLSPDGKELIFKSYIHIGFAVDTPEGLVVPVIRDVATKSVMALSQEIVALSGKARRGELTPGDMQGGCMTISSLGGIGGEFFTPIVNAPEVAILGLSKSSIQPVYDGNAFMPRLQLPLSLSYDHRVIDGAEGARFLVYFSEQLQAQAHTTL